MVGDLNLTKLVGVFLVFLGGVKILQQGMFRTFPGMIPLLGLAALPILVHGYLNAGLLFQILLVITILSTGLNLRLVSEAGAWFLGLLLVLVLAGIGLKGDLSFLRTQNFPSEVYLATPLANPNVAARTVIIVLPLLFLASLRGLLGPIPWRLLLTGSIMIVAVVAISRANSLALIVMFFYWELFGRRKVTVKRRFRNAIVALLVGGGAVMATPMQEKLDRAVEIMGSTYQLLQQAESGQLVYEQTPARAKTWAGTLLVVRESPWFGVGEYTKEHLAQVGSQQGGHTIAVHGTFLNILISNGVFGLALFFLALFRLYRALDHVGRMFLFGISVSQVGADITTHTLFWAILAIFLVFDPKKPPQPQPFCQPEILAGKRAIP